MFAEQFDIALDYQKRLAPADGFLTSANEFFSNKRCIGANVTMPFKGAALAWVNSLSLQAKRAGAVNTIIRKGDNFIGDNTDGIGLVSDLYNHDVLLKDANVLLIGAGGAAKGALPALVDANISKVSIYNRSPLKAKELVDYTNSYSLQKATLYDPKNDRPFDLIINATSLSLHGELPNLPEQIFTGAPCVYDMVYLSRPTAFLEKASTMGCSKNIDGLGMLINQAAHSFFLWFDKRPNCDPVFRYLRQ
jgi:shikimate dehydrogenase